MKYSKPSISLEQQVKRLIERGLKIDNPEKAAHYLSNISYYRLRAYTYPFQDNSDPNHPFTVEVSFEQIIQLYVFDRHLRLLVFDGLEKIEIALRTKIIYEYAQVYGSHWHDRHELYTNQVRFTKDITKLYEEVDRSTETFIKHYKAKYSNPEYPPSWMTLEVASMGLLSKLFENLKKTEPKKKVVQGFGLKNHLILESWMHAFSHLRNVCAHHGRLWNRRFTTLPMIPNDTVYPFLSNKSVYPNKLYTILSCMLYVLQIISPGHQLKSKLKELFKDCAEADLREMGFPKDWVAEDLWQ